MLHGFYYEGLITLQQLQRFQVQFCKSRSYASKAQNQALRTYWECYITNRSEKFRLVKNHKCVT